MNKRERSNSGDSYRRFTLPKSRILSGRRKFDQLFSKSTLITSPTVNLRFATYFESDEKILVGFIAPKRIGNAVKRTRTKRLLREAYRLNQHILTDIPQKISGSIHFVFLARHSELDFQKVQENVVTLLQELRSRILSNVSPV